MCYTNKKRIEINKILMDKQVKKNGAGLKLKANLKNSNSQDVELLDNMPIISMKTDSKLGIVNKKCLRLNQFLEISLKLQMNIKLLK